MRGRIPKRISVFTLTARVVLLLPDLPYMILCSILSVTYRQSAWVWLPAWGAFLLSSGAKGKRFALPNSEIMIHQPSGGAQGQATEIEITAKQILKIRERLNKILADNTGKPIDIIAKDTERDNFMSADEALDYGLVDKILYKR